MKGIVRIPRGSGWKRGSVVGLVGALLAIASSGEACAGAIHHGKVTQAESRSLAEWSGYVQAGPTMWTRVEHPPVTQALVSAIWHSIRADQMAHPMIQFLLWKQSLDPTRFARYHPKLSPALHRIARWHTSAPPLVIPTPTTSGGTATSNSSPPTPPPTEPQNLIPDSTPEPSSMLIAAALAAWAVVRTRYGRVVD
jgi:hypothetical protein